MIFETTALAGAYTVELAKIGDERGFFARSYCRNEFAEHGLNTDVKQCNMSFNAEEGTLRGLHYQTDPAPESKYIRCIRGAIRDVIVDLRESSPTYLEHIAVELTADNRRALYVPEHFAHGFITLVPDTEVLYQVTEFYTPETERGLRYDDPRLGIDWGVAINSISEKDQQWAYMS